MTNEKQNEMSAEEKKAAALEQLRQDRKNNLESLLSYSAANYLKSTEAPFGSMGNRAGNFAFNEFLTSKKANEIREASYNQKVQEAQSYGTISQPEYTTNYELERNALGLIQDAQVNLSLKDLADVVKKIAPGLKVDIPDKIQNMNYTSLVEKAQKAGEDYKPTQDEEGFADYFQNLTTAYKSFAGYGLIGRTMTAKYNEKFKEFSEKFAPKTSGEGGATGK